MVNGLEGKSPSKLEGNRSPVDRYGRYGAEDKKVHRQ